jgi:hypothetical protein
LRDLSSLIKLIGLGLTYIYNLIPMNQHYPNSIRDIHLGPTIIYMTCANSTHEQELSPPMCSELT